jgi:hypothetical protein
VAIARRNGEKIIAEPGIALDAITRQTPAFQAWLVTSKGDNSFWTKVGAAWPHRDGKGLSLILSVIPMNGQIVLREPLPKA